VCVCVYIYILVFIFIFFNLNFKVGTQENSSINSLNDVEYKIPILLEKYVISIDACYFKNTFYKITKI
jgi:hypothetical protein